MPKAPLIVAALLSVISIGLGVPLLLTSIATPSHHLYKVLLCMTITGAGSTGSSSIDIHGIGIMHVVCVSSNSVCSSTFLPERSVNIMDPFNWVVQGCWFPPAKVYNNEGVMKMVHHVGIKPKTS